MGNAIGDVLSPAAGVALSPLPIVGVILILFSSKARRNGPAFAIGWAVALAVVGALVIAAKGPAHLADEGSAPSTTGTVVNLVLGLALIVLAVRQWRGRSKDGDVAQLPKWMQMIEDAPTPLALWFGVSLSAINPKNLIFTVAAATSIAQADVSVGGEALALAIFVLLASVTVAGPVVWYMLRPDAASSRLTGIKNWMIQNNAVIMAVVLLVLGVSQLGKGLGGLS